jgi:hypothetical protein
MQVLLPLNKNVIFLGDVSQTCMFQLRRPTLSYLMYKVLHSWKLISFLVMVIILGVIANSFTVQSNNTYLNKL